MDKKKIRSIIQPVMLQEVNGKCMLKCERTDPQVIARAPHLADVVGVFQLPLQSGASRRYILQAPDRDLAYQAAAALLSLTAASDNAYPQEEQDLDEILWEEFRQEDSSYDCVIRSQDDFVQEPREEMMAVISIVRSQDSQEEEKQEDPDFLFVDCGEVFHKKLSEKLSFLSSRMILLWVKNVSVCRLELEQLMFEQGYRMIQVPKPEPSYYEEVMREYLTLCGYSQQDYPDLREPVRRLMQYRNQYFQMNDIFRFADQAMLHAETRQSPALSVEDFRLPRIGVREEPEERLRNMIGLEEVKRQIEKVCAERILLENRKDMRLMQTGYHLAFAGPPGTGKSEVAALYAQILARSQVTNGAFISASRADIIGQYLGHTAPKIKELFHKADGGVLFIDEVGGMCGTDDYTREAVTEFVRFMEQCPQTTVVFATYPDQMERFLNQDPGLKSRISRVIYFPPYTDGELLQILYCMAEKEGLGIEEGNEAFIRDVWKKLRIHQGESFGNAREVRRFLKASFSNYCVRAWREKRKEEKKPDFVITRSEMEEALRDLLPKRRKAQSIGFQVCGQEAEKNPG